MIRSTVAIRYLVHVLVFTAPAVLLGQEQRKTEPPARGSTVVITAPALFDAPKNPFAVSFGIPAPQASPDQSSITATDLKPRVVCGMTIIPADPKIDRQMIKSPPADPKITYSLRLITPPVCTDDK